VVLVVCIAHVSLLVCLSSHAKRQTYYCPAATQLHHQHHDSMPHMHIASFPGALLAHAQPPTPPQCLSFPAAALFLASGAAVSIREHASALSRDELWGRE